MRARQAALLRPASVDSDLQGLFAGIAELAFVPLLRAPTAAFAPRWPETPGGQAYGMMPRARASQAHDLTTRQQFDS